MDSLDEKLITLLRHDARRSISDLAIDLKVSRATVRARIDRLENAGDIVGYTVILRADAIEQAVRGIMMINIAGHAADRVVRALGGFLGGHRRPHDQWTLGSGRGTLGRLADGFRCRPQADQADTGNNRK